MACRLLNCSKPYIPHMIKCISENPIRNSCSEVQSRLIASKDKYQVNLTVKGYDKNNLSVVVGHDVLLVKGQKEIRDNNKSTVSCFVKAFNLPKGCNGSEITSILTRGGILKIYAPRKPGGASDTEPKSDVVVVPISKQDYFRIKPVKLPPSDDDKWSSKYTYMQTNSPDSKTSEPKSCE